MADAIKKVAVIGAGVMGCGIAAQIANAGVPVLLLDILPKDGENRNAVAEAAVARANKTDPAPFMSAAAPKLIECGNIDDHLARVAECDWIVEVVVERLDVKQASLLLAPCLETFPILSQNTHSLTSALAQVVLHRSSRGI